MEKNMLALMSRFAMWLTLGILLTTQVSAEEYLKGTHYKQVASAVDSPSSEKVKVIEFFSYACPHCFKFESNVQSWLKKGNKDAEFTRVPAIFNAKYELLAKAYYTAEILGVTEKVHQALFDAIHVKRLRIKETEDIRSIFVEHGVDGKEFDATFRSFSMATKIIQAKSLAKKFKLEGVPTLVIADQFMTDSHLAGGYDQMFKVVDSLVAKHKQ